MVNDAFFHHKEEIFFGVGEWRDVVEGIALDNDKVGDGAGSKGAESAFHADESGANSRGAQEDVARRKDSGADGELFVLAEMRGAQEVRSERHGDACVAKDGEAFEAGATDVFDFRDRGCGQAESGAVLREGLVGDKRWDGDSLGLSGTASGGRVDVVAMLEGVNAAVDGAGNRLGGVDVRGDIGVSVAALLDSGPNFIWRVAVPVNRVRGAGHAAAAHDFDEGRAFAELLTAGEADLVDAIGDAAEGSGVRRPAVGVIAVVAGTGVGVASGFGEGFATGEEARAGGKSLGDGFGKSGMRAAGVADTGESAFEHAFKNGHGAENRERRGKLGVGGEIHH